VRDAAAYPSEGLFVLSVGEREGDTICEGGITMVKDENISTATRFSRLVDWWFPRLLIFGMLLIIIAALTSSPDTTKEEWKCDKWRFRGSANSSFMDLSTTDLLLLSHQCYGNISPLFSKTWNDNTSCRVTVQYRDGYQWTFRQSDDAKWVETLYAAHQNIAYTADAKKDCIEWTLVKVLR